MYNDSTNVFISEKSGIPNNTQFVSENEEIHNVHLFSFIRKLE